MSGRRALQVVVAVLVIGACAAIAAPDPPSSEDLKARLSDPEFLARARAYTMGSYWLFLADSAVTMIALAWLVFSGLSAAGWRWLKEKTGGGARATLLYIAVFAVFMSIVSLPLEYYDGYIREHAYGFSTQNSASWLADWIKGLSITIVGAALFLVPLYALIRRFPRTWWMLGTALGCAFALFLVAISPVFIDPLFNEFTPLQDKALKEKILDLAHRNGIAADEVFQMDASTRSVHDNAYVTGLLGTERIVLYDVLIQSYTPDEVAFVMSHEMGHYVMHHMWKGLALAMLLIVAAFYLVDRCVRWTTARWARRTGLTDPAEFSTLPLMLLVLSIFLFVTMPIQSAYSRHLETAADQFALETVPDPSSGPDAFRKMTARNLSDPDPPALIEWFLYSHPAVGKRIRAAEEYVASHRPPA